MFEGVSKPARAVLSLGQEEAQLLGHGEIRTDHLLLGIIRLPEDPVIGPMVEQSGDQAAVALLDLGVDLDRARARIVALRGCSAATEGQLPMADETREVLSEGLLTALRLRRKIEPSHLLLAMIVRPSAAAQTLDQLGISLAELRKRLSE